MKEEIATDRVLHYYKVNPKLQVVVESDASSYGLGAWLSRQQQNPGDPALKPVAFSSRALTQTEQRYNNIERESLAAIWTLEKFDHYIRG